MIVYTATKQKFVDDVLLRQKAIPDSRHSCIFPKYFG